MQCDSQPCEFAHWEHPPYRNEISRLLSQTALRMLDYALSTKPDFRQEVHTYIFCAPPFTFTLTDLTLEFQILLVFLFE